MKSSPVIYSLAENFSFRELPNGKVRAFNATSQMMIESDAWAGVIWDCLKEKKTLPELKEILAKRKLEISTKHLFQALPDFIEDCVKLQIIESFQKSES